MNNPYFDLLMWARGPAFDIALTIFVAGMLIRILEILVLGRKKDFAKPKGNPVGQGVKTVFTRSVPRKGLVKFAPITYIGGYIFHIGFLIAFFLFAPHIALIDSLIGINYPGVGRVIIESATALALLAIIALFWSRMTDPVRRALTTWQDYLLLILSALPLITGYVAVNKLFGDGTLMLALHILSVELLMVAFPFTKLTHAFTFVIARYYNGTIQGRKGAET
jgi:nitrate reductase gamma subunit